MNQNNIEKKILIYMNERIGEHCITINELEAHTKMKKNDLTEAFKTLLRRNLIKPETVRSGGIENSCCSITPKGIETICPNRKKQLTNAIIIIGAISAMVGALVTILKS